jgi:hypothetical protein
MFEDEEKFWEEMNLNKKNGDKRGEDGDGKEERDGSGSGRQERGSERGREA